MTFEDFGRSADPFNPEEAIAAFRADLATPRPLRPQIILVRNAQEATLIASMIDNARACRADIQRSHRQIREGVEEV